jgi:hypothetical protein
MRMPLSQIVFDQLEKFIVLKNLVNLGKFWFHINGQIFDDCPEAWIGFISVS